MVLIPPEEFRKMHENDSLEQLLQIKMHINNFILEYESGKYDGCNYTRIPTHLDQYNNYKAILIELNDLIVKKDRKTKQETRFLMDELERLANLHEKSLTDEEL